MSEAGGPPLASREGPLLAAGDPDGPGPAARVRRPLCANCGAEATSRFCPDCGQEMRESRLTLPNLLHEFVDEYLNFDSRVLRSIGYLLFRPGFLTRAYIEGKRQRYVRPFRLFLITSILFFFSAAALVRTSVLDRIQIDPGFEQRIQEEVRPSARGDQPAVTGQGAGDEVAGVEAAPPARPSFEDRLKLRAEAISDRGLGLFARDAAQRFWSDLPKVIFVLLPVFALFLKLLYLRRGRSYVEHFIYSLHLHSFAFVVFTALVLLRGVPHSGWLAASIPLYAFVAQRRVYGQGFFRTTIKFGMLGSAYLLTALLAVVGAVLLILWFV